MKKPRKIVGYKGLTDDLVEQFEQCKSYSQFEMQMILRGVDLQGDEKVRTLCRNKLVRRADTLIDMCVKRDYPFKFNLERIDFLKEFWKHPRGLFNGDLYASDEFLLKATDLVSEYDIRCDDEENANIGIWKDLVKFFIETSSPENLKTVA